MQTGGSLARRTFKSEKAMFNLDNFVTDCRSAVRRDPTHNSVTELLTRALEDPAALVKALGEPKKSGITPIYQ